MAITFVNSVASGLGTNGGTTDAFDSTGANFIVVTLAMWESPAPSISDNKGNTYTVLTLTGTGTGASACIAYAKNATVGTGHTVTVSASDIYPGAVVAAFAGVDTTSPFDVQNGASSNYGTTKQPGSVTPTNDNSVVITAERFGDSSPSETIDSPFTGNAILLAYGDSGSSQGNLTSYEIQTTATARNPTFSGVSTSRTAKIAVFKAAAGGGGTRQQTLSLLGIGV